MEPMAGWSWKDMYLMQASYSLRQLVWSKTKEAQKKIPTGEPQIIAPDFILKAIKEAEEKRGKLGKKQHTPDARSFATTEELDAYLKKPRKRVDE